MSLVNQVVRVQGQGEQRHGKDLKFGGRSFMNEFSLCRLLTLYVLHDQMVITCHIIKWKSSQQNHVYATSNTNCVSLQDIFKRERICVSLAVDKIPQIADVPQHVTR